MRSLGYAALAERPQSTLLFGSFDAWVGREVLPGIQSGALDQRDMIAVIATLRRWRARRDMRTGYAR